MRISAVRRREDVALAAGLATLLLALGPWSDRLADSSFAWHMAQHVVLMLVAAPLLLLGAPVRRILAALPQSAARKLRGPLRFAENPVAAWLTFALTLYVTHFSPLYEASLEHPMVHALEHGLLLGAGLVFWTPILAVPPQPHPLPFAARLFYVFMAMPIGAFLSLALYTTSHPMYPYYEQRLGWHGALEDQEYGGEIMWLSGGAVLFVALMWLASGWLHDEQRKAQLADRSY